MTDNPKERRGTFAESLGGRSEAGAPPTALKPSNVTTLPREDQVPGEPGPAAAANDESPEEVLNLGGQRNRAYSGQKSITGRNGLASIYFYDTESGLAYEIDYSEFKANVWDYKYEKALIIQYDSYHVGIEGERLKEMLPHLSARRYGEVSAAVHPNLDPRSQGVPHIRNVVVRLAGFIRIRDGKLDARDEWEEPERTT
jgi:hypothetical protein